MIRIKNILLTLFVLCLTFWANAQGGDTPSEQTTGMRAHGKIFVVLAVAITILTGLIFYVIRLDRKISRLEKNA